MPGPHLLMQRSSTMRTQVTRASLAGAIVSGLLLGAIGCDDYHTGDLSDPGGPLLLLRVLVQDSPTSVSTTVSAGGTTRRVALVLLDNDPPILCNDTTPCNVLTAYEGGPAAFTCRQATCT